MMDAIDWFFIISNIISAVMNIVIYACLGLSLILEGRPVRIFCYEIILRKRRGEC